MPVSLLALPFLPLFSFIITLSFGKQMGTKAHWLPIITVLLSFCCAVAAFFRVQSGLVIDQDLYTWIRSGDFHVSVGFLVDQLTAVMLLVVTSVSSLVHIYSVGYMRGESGYYRFFAYLSLFTFSMLMLVLGNNFLQLFFGWEAVGLSSYLLIGFYYEKKSASDAGKKAFIVNRFGDFGFILGLLLIFTQFGSLHYAEVFKLIPQLPGLQSSINLLGVDVSIVTLIAFLLFCGAIGKSAQIPLHVWLPDAMEGPTPVSALIHAATMVTAGVFLVARCNPLFSLSAVALDCITVLGAITALFAATIALVQTDIKRVVAYSTVSQLAYMFIACGVGAYSAGIFHLFTHAFFKALLFLGCGSVILGMHHEQDLRFMGGLKKYMPITYWTFLAASLSISGVPLLAGFFSKDEILLMAFNSERSAAHFAYWVGLFVAFLTAFYSFRLFFLVFHGKFRGTEEQKKHLHESPLVITIPLLILAIGAISAGWVGVPTVLHGDNHWAEFLKPVLGHPHVHLSHGAELGLMFASVLVGAAGIALAYLFYRKRPDIPELLAQRFAAFYRILQHKYYIDEFYNTVIVRPALAFGQIVLLRGVDTKVIEGIVNGLPRAIMASAQKLRFLQSGNVSNYLAGMGLGALFVLVVLLLHH